MSDSGFKKDVFVSYSSSDVSWVDEQLLKRLRDRRINYIEPRDFEKGCIRLNEVENAIKFSRHTLLVVTSSFLANAWNEFENGMTFSFVLETGSWRIIPIIKEENLELPPRLGALVSFKVFDADEDEWTSFAQKLALAPPSVESSSVNSQQPERVSLPTPPKDHAARNGLDLLLELMQNIKVRSALSEFRAYFEELNERIETLDRLKKLHDIFQQVEDIHNNIRRFGKNDLSQQVDWEDIEEIEPDLRVKAAELVSRACHSGFAKADDFWVQKFNRATADIRSTFSNRQVISLRSATNRIGDILNSVPSKVNTGMVTVAKGLRLTSLERALMDVHAILKDRDPLLTNQGQLTKIEKSVAKIDQMDRSLKTILFVHDTLQDIDNELRRVEVSLNDGILQIQDLWQDLKPQMSLLCADQKHVWAIDLAAASQELENSFHTDAEVPNESGIRRAFRFFRSQANRTFNQVDGEMLQQCNELRSEIGTPVAPLLALLQGASEE
ncbi:MAG TPA: toll/interleukin-1 receptor domain-containing protein [Pyrinomonadaceae bacterium]|nr:toll/interleukin-1 receptor domain-containing protein [Pyrinomonadaceae bacterium]